MIDLETSPAVGSNCAVGSDSDEGPNYAKLSHIRSGFICPVVRLKSRVGCTYVILLDVLSGVYIERVERKMPPRFVSYDVLVRLYDDIPVSLMFNIPRIAKQFSPVVYINDD